MRGAIRCALFVVCELSVLVGSADAQSRLAILQAEDRRAPTANDLATLRSAARSGDPRMRGSASAPSAASNGRRSSPTS